MNSSQRADYNDMRLVFIECGGVWSNFEVYLQQPLNSATKLHFLKIVFALSYGVIIKVHLYYPVVSVND